MLHFLLRRSFFLEVEWLNEKTEQLKEWFTKHENQIRTTSSSESMAYVENIQRAAKEIFNKSAHEYKKYIQLTLNDFVSEQTDQVLELLTLGHSPKKVFDTFNERKVFNLAKEIYDHLDHDIRPKIAVAWLSNRARLNVIAKLIGGNFSSMQVKRMTEEAIKKVLWERLRRFVDAAVVDIFKDAFKRSAKARFYEWLDLASSREIIRSIKDIANVLPDVLEQEIYSEEFMFGTTPIYNAIKKASLRLMDTRFSGYQKTLIILSDGEFSDDFIPEATDLLKSCGVTIISLHISNKNIVGYLVEMADQTWARGSKIMLEMSSVSSEIDGVSRTLAKLHYKLGPGKKLFVQVNHSKTIEDILDALLIH
jgi:hypothetical protein